MAGFVGKRHEAGLVDDGTVREQWGVFESTIDSHEDFVFPYPFKEDTIPNLQTTFITEAAAQPINIVLDSITNLGFSVNRHNDTSNSDSPYISWRAIGAKP